jgi:hypothetical protein
MAGPRQRYASIGGVISMALFGWSRCGFFIADTSIPGSFFIIEISVVWLG